MEYGGFKLMAGLFASLVTLLVGLAWPVTFLILIYVLARNAGAIQKFINEFMQDKQSVEVSAGLKEGLLVKIVSQQVQSGLTQQLEKDSGRVSIEQQSAVQHAADSAAAKLLQQASQPPDTRMKILWVDDHPQNNIGLQYAFQALGMIVVCADSNAAIFGAFTTAGHFDVVITDMFRDEVGSRPAEPNAGLQTIDIVKVNYPKVPIIIYAGKYSAQHASEPVSPPVLANTNDTQKVFDLVFDIASKKLK
jgi:CheY-like chemotaxis protein